METLRSLSWFNRLYSMLFVATGVWALTRGEWVFGLAVLVGLVVVLVLTAVWGIAVVSVRRA
ncbi:hypothetical protein JQN72_15080 [Phycicoccus sp. CSK15P-2]|uniref:hypothetical protein n=1 Tax=Phycicoccus sp. CSK15P-2 TaxID=2807627 RepID=UPI00194DE569|nr:hypothetical protein [Phycicoccus sp. CSK15P-2]MBM6405567.1 hypothetical protein [Phycicoccus sp. CSK15P-2]